VYPPSNAAAGSTSFRGDAKPYRGHKVAIKSPQEIGGFHHVSPTKWRKTMEINTSQRFKQKWDTN